MKTPSSHTKFMEINAYALSSLEKRDKTIREPETVTNPKRRQMENSREHTSQIEKLEPRTSIGQSCNVQIPCQEVVEAGHRI